MKYFFSFCVTMRIERNDEQHILAQSGLFRRLHKWRTVFFVCQEVIFKYLSDKVIDQSINELECNFWCL